MSRIPAGIPLNRLDYINTADIPEEDRTLLAKWNGMVSTGPQYTSNQQILLPVEVVEDFYSNALPFIKQRLNK
jgi:hypothetical protein